MNLGMNAFADAYMQSQGVKDPNLYNALAHANRHKTVLERSTPLTRVTLLTYASAVWELLPKPKPAIQDFAQAFLYGFQIGHDIALARGQVLEFEEDSKWKSSEPGQATE